MNKDRQNDYPTIVLPRLLGPARVVKDLFAELYSNFPYQQQIVVMGRDNISISNSCIHMIIKMIDKDQILYFIGAGHNLKTKVSDAAVKLGKERQVVFTKMSELPEFLK